MRLIMCGKHQKHSISQTSYRQRESQFNPKATHRRDVRVHTHAEKPQGAAGGHAELPHKRQQQNVQHRSDCLPTKDTKNQVKDEK